MISLQVVAYEWKIKRPEHFPFIFSLCKANYILKHDPEAQLCRSCREASDPERRREGIRVHYHRSCVCQQSLFLHPQIARLRSVRVDDGMDGSGELQNDKFTWETELSELC